MVSTVCVYSVVPWSDCSDATVLFCAFVRRGQFLKLILATKILPQLSSVQHAAVRRQSRSLIGLGRDKSEVCKVRYPTRDGTTILYEYFQRPACATSTTSAHVFLTRLKSTSTAAAGGPEHLFGITNIIRLFASGFLVPQRGRGPDATDPSFLALQTYQQKQASLGSHVTHNHSYLLS